MKRRAKRRVICRASCRSKKRRAAPYSRARCIFAADGTTISDAAEEARLPKAQRNESAAVGGAHPHARRGGYGPLGQPRGRRLVARLRHILRRAGGRGRGRGGDARAAATLARRRVPAARPRLGYPRPACVAYRRQVVKQTPKGLLPTSETIAHLLLRCMRVNDCTTLILQASASRHLRNGTPVF